MPAPFERERRPWPMKWVVVAIILVLVPYTFISLRYRKEGPAFRPYEDMKNRANTTRLLSAGYQRIALTAQRPADPLKNPFTIGIMPAAGGLPEELRTTLVEPPTLPAEITRVAALGETAGAEPYPIRFACTLPDDKRQLAGADLYLKGSEIVIVPDFERIAGGLAARSNDSVVQVTIPPGALKPGRYEVTIAGQRTSRAWSLHVR